MATSTIEEVLESIPALPEEIQEIIDAEAKLDKLNVPRVVPPLTEDGELSSEPKYPADLSAIGDQFLGQTYGMFMAWSGYMRYLLNLKEADILVTKGRLNLYRKMLRREVDKSYSELGLKTQEMRGNYVEADSVLLQLEKLLLRFESEKKVVEARYYHFDSCSRALSREISRREYEKEKQRPGLNSGETYSHPGDHSPNIS